MSGTIRPLTRADLPAAVLLYEREIGTGSSLAGLERYFETILFDDPWADPELPSLAYVDDDGTLAGFFSRCTRRFLFDGEPVRVCAMIHFVVAPEARKRAAAALLAARLLGGPQDASHTDGANLPTRRLWGAMKGRVMQLESLEWTRVLRPAAYWQERAIGRRLSPRSAAVTKRLAVPVDLALLRAAGARVKPSAEVAATTDEPLTPSAVVEHIGELAGWARLRPDYDEPYVRWLFAQLAATRTYGELSARLVKRDGVPIGWHVSMIERGGLAEVFQVATRPADATTVFGALIDHTRAQGAIAVRGRIEAPLIDAITQERSVMRRSNWALLRARDPELATAALLGDSFLTRLDSNIWMDTRGR